MRTYWLINKLFSKDNVPNIIYYLLGSVVLIYFYGWKVYGQIVLFLLGIWFILELFMNVSLLFKKQLRLSGISLYVEIVLSLVVFLLIVSFLPVKIWFYILFTSILASIIRFLIKKN